MTKMCHGYFGKHFQADTNFTFAPAARVGWSVGMPCKMSDDPISKHKLVPGPFLDEIFEAFEAFEAKHLRACALKPFSPHL
ncbi:hypothetical protein AK812_SmicGene33652, partial [Symbiodinium microadriaticum]